MSIRPPRSFVVRLLGLLTAPVCFATAAVMVLVLVVAAPAGAHNELLGSSPAAGEVYGAPIERLEVQFDDTVTFPNITLESPDGRTISGLASSPRLGNIRVTLPEAETMLGTWTLRWSVRSADTDLTEGEFTFLVIENGPPLRPLPESLVAQPAADHDSERSPIFLVALGVTLALGAILVWVAFDALSRRIRVKNEQAQEDP